MRRAWAIIICLLCAGSLALALDRYAAYAQGSSRLDATLESLAASRALRETHPLVFSTSQAAGSGKDRLKALVQDCGAKQGLGIAYLSEAEREVGKGAMERQVVCRAVGVPHDKLVKFLASLEAQGEGAKIKEIRLKPAKEKSGIYEEAEAVVAVRWLTPEGLKATKNE